MPNQEAQSGTRGGALVATGQLETLDCEASLASLAIPVLGRLRS